MTVWYGRWVTSYVDGDVVQILLKENGKIVVGRLVLPEKHFSDSWYVATRESIITGEDILVVSPFDYWYRDNSDKLYDAYIESVLRKER